MTSIGSLFIVKRARSKRKSERNKIKSKIKRSFLKGLNNQDVHLTCVLDKDKEQWIVSWDIHELLPDDFDAENREGIIQEPHILEKANHIRGIVNNHIINQFPEAHITDKNEFVLTQPFPPLHITKPSVYSSVGYRKWVVVEKARLLTEDEIQDWINSVDPEFQDEFRDWIKRDKEAMKYFKYVGPADDEFECWKLIRYIGIRVFGQFTLPAQGKYRPSYLDER